MLYRSKKQALPQMQQIVTGISPYNKQKQNMVAKKSHDMILDRNHLKKRELDLTKNDDIKRRQHNSYTNRFKKIDSDMETKYHKVHKEKAMSSLGKDVTKVLDTHSLGITQALANTQTMSIAQTAGTTHIMGNNHKQKGSIKAIKSVQMINKQKGADIAVARVTGKDVMDLSPYILRNNRLRSTSKFKTSVNNTLIVEPKTLPIKQEQDWICQQFIQKEVYSFDDDLQFN